MNLHLQASGSCLEASDIEKHLTYRVFKHLLNTHYICVKLTEAYRDAGGFVCIVSKRISDFT